LSGNIKRKYVLAFYLSELSGTNGCVVKFNFIAIHIQIQDDGDDEIEFTGIIESLDSNSLVVLKLKWESLYTGAAPTEKNC